MGQIDSVSKSLLEILLRKQHPTDTLFYTDRLGDWPITRIKEWTRRRIFVGHSGPNKLETIHLSIKEKMYLDSTVGKLRSYYWLDSLFRDSKRIPVDSMWPRIQAKIKESYQSSLNDTLRTDITKSVGNRVHNANTFQFAPPIYFRNKSICLIYILRLCGGLCGEDELTFYKWEKGSYKKWFLFAGAAF